MRLRHIGAIFAVIVILAASAIAQRPDEPPGLEVSNAVHYDLSQRLGDITPVPPGGGPARVHPLGELPEVPGTTGNPDAAIQNTVGALAPGAGFGFQGVGVGNYAVNAAPPDTNGAAGRDYVNSKDLFIQWVNEDFAIFDRSDGSFVQTPVAGNTLWLHFGGLCETHNDGDPIVLYDHLANRWVFSQFAIGSSSYLQCLAISQTSDPLGQYFRYSFSYTNLNDYPKFGIWPDAYYATHNMFKSTIFGWSFQGAKICAYDRAKMLVGQAATQQCFSTSTSYGGLLPSDLDGANPPPAGSPNFVLNFGANILNLWKFHVDWATPANSTFTGPTSIAVASFSAACGGGGTCIPQSGTTQQLDSLADRLMYRLAYRNFGDHESLVVNHSVAAGSAVGVRWYEIRSPNGTPSVFQQGTFSPDSTYRWMGSIAMDQAGDIGLGYSASSSSLHPGIRYTGRVPSDSLGTLESETTVLTGAGSQLSNLSRWGDYSSMSVDPVDDCTFWFTTEYLNNNGTFNWSTWITSFKFGTCGSGSVTPPGPPTGLTASGGVGQINLSWSTSTGATSYNVRRGTTSGGESLSDVASGITATTYLDTGLAAGTFYYVVEAVNSSGTSLPSNEAFACASPVAPNLTATGGNLQVALSWSASPGATFTVRRSTTSGGPYTQLASGLTVTTYTDSTAANGTPYYYVVTATGPCDPVANSNEASATPNAVAIPPAPTNLQASAGPGAKKISLTWSASTGATSYNVYRSTVSGGPYSTTVATGVTTTTYANTGLASKATYYYVVSAVNAGGESGQSNQASATPR